MTLQATFKPIGEIVTPYKTLADCPRNIDPNGPPCELVLRDGLRDGLLGLAEAAALDNDHIARGVGRWRRFLGVGGRAQRNC